jgi:hypothetical protein
MQNLRRGHYELSVDAPSANAGRHCVYRTRPSDLTADPARVQHVRRFHNATAPAGEQGRLVRAFSLRHDFPDQWNRLTSAPGTSQSISIGIDRFPFTVKDETIKLWKVGVYARGTGIDEGTDVPVTLEAPTAAYTGQDPQPLIRPAPVAVSDGAALYEFDLEADDWTPITVKAGAAPPWRIEIPPAAPALTDLVIAFWWRLA